MMMKNDGLMAIIHWGDVGVEMWSFLLAGCICHRVTTDLRTRQSLIMSLMGVNGDNAGLEIEFIF